MRGICTAIDGLIKLSSCGQSFVPSSVDFVVKDIEKIKRNFECLECAGEQSSVGD